jgi:predicted enzyme related to lactoylglutathione lyase
MGHPTHHHHINYIEFASTDIERTKQFYATVFG